MGTNQDEEEVLSLSGEIVDISSRFWKEGWGFGKLKVGAGHKERGQVIKICGALEGHSVGEFISITGRWESTKYGNQVSIETIISDTPVGFAGIRKWLIDRIPQIGPKRAAEAASRFGDRIWGIIEDSPQELEVISGLTWDRVAAIVKAYHEFQNERVKLVPFYDLGLVRSEAHTAMKLEISPEEICQGPFILYLKGIVGFSRAEALSNKAKAPRTHKMRLMSSLVQAARDASFEGHTAVDREHLFHVANEYAEVSTPLLEAALDEALSVGWLHHWLDDALFALPELASAERFIAKKIVSLLQRGEVDGKYQAGPDPGAGTEDDDDAEGGDRYGPAGMPSEGSVDPDGER